MSIPQILTDEQAAAIWSGETASLANFNDNNDIKDPIDKPNDDSSDNNDDDKKVEVVQDDDLKGIWNEGEDEDDDEDDEDDDNTDTKNVKPSSTPDKKPGRKPSDLVSMVNQLVKEDILFGFQDQEEISTIEEAKELIKENLKYKEENAIEDLWKRKVESFSPQIQAIIQYAEKGGTDVSTLLNAIGEVETVVELTVDTEEGQEEIVRQALRNRNFDEDEINDQIETLKDLDKLKQKAEKYKPELERLKEEKINQLMQEQESRIEKAKKASEIYLKTVQQTLDQSEIGSLKLGRDEKFMIMDALAEPKYKSIGGYNVNGFIKSLEDLQFGENANYEHFLNIVHFAVDRDSFIQKLKETITTDLSLDTVKKLKTSKSTSSNSADNIPDTRTAKPKIQKQTFRNPYAR